MAGSAALILLTINTIQSPLDAFIYIAFFGIGSILGMALLSCVIAVPLRYSSTNLPWVYNGLHVVVAIFTLSIGSTMIFNYI
jgi:hypothetical protein